MARGQFWGSLVLSRQISEAQKKCAAELRLTTFRRAISSTCAYFEQRRCPSSLIISLLHFWKSSSLAVRQSPPLVAQRASRSSPFTRISWQVCAYEPTGAPPREAPTGAATQRSAPSWFRIWPWHFL